MSEYVLNTYELSKCFGKYKALQCVNMNIRRGAVYALIGQNGAGKSTLISILAGLSLPSSGTYKLFDVKSNSGGKEALSTRRRIGILSEAPALLPHFTATEMLKLHSHELALSDSLQQIHMTLELVGLSNAGKKKIKNFSLGMKQRLGIGLALLGTPDLLFLDEPINGLDPTGIVDFRNLVIRLHESRPMLTIVISSHILSELSQIATCYGFIHKGRLIKEIESHHILSNSGGHIKLVTDDNTKVSSMLKGNSTLIEIENGALLVDNCNLPIDEVIRRLVHAGISIHHCSYEDNSLESIYLSITR